MINVVDLMKLQPTAKYPHGLPDAEHNALFTTDNPIIFAFHGHPTLVHELNYERVNRNIHVHGYQKEGTITIPFDCPHWNRSMVKAHPQHWLDCSFQKAIFSRKMGLVYGIWQSRAV